MVRRLVGFLKRFFPSKPAIWESIGSPSYRRAVKEVHIGRQMRRKAWKKGPVVCLRDPNHDLCSGWIKVSEAVRK